MFPVYQWVFLELADQEDSLVDRMNKLGKKADSFVNGVREHGKLSFQLAYLY